MKKTTKLKHISLNHLFDKHMKTDINMGDGELFKASSLVNALDKIIIKANNKPEIYVLDNDISNEWNLNIFFNIAILKNKLNTAVYFISETNLVKDFYPTAKDLKYLVNSIDERCKSKENKKSILNKLIKKLDIDTLIVEHVLSNKNTEDELIKKDKTSSKLVCALNSYFDKQIELEEAVKIEEENNLEITK